MDAESILRVLDSSAPLYFPPVNDPKFRFAAARMTAFRGVSDEWALAIEMFGFLPIMVGDERLIDTVTIFRGPAAGDSANRTRETAKFCPIRSHRDFPLWETPTAKDATLSDPAVLLVGDLLNVMPVGEIDGAGQSCGRIRIRGDHFARALVPIFGDALFLETEQLQDLCGRSVRPLLRTAAWEHPDIMGDEIPSDLGSFQSLAEAIVSSDPTRFRPGKANTHWDSWEDRRL